jgi:hypothetical protein
MAPLARHFVDNHISEIFEVESNAKMPVVMFAPGCCSSRWC